jgi:hypothetical protein
MAAHLRGAEMDGQGIGQAIRNSLVINSNHEEISKEPAILQNRAGDSRSPYVRAHSSNPVAWQIWGDEAIELAQKENKLLFVSIGYSACHCK